MSIIQPATRHLTDPRSICIIEIRGIQIPRILGVGRSMFNVDTVSFLRSFTVLGNQDSILFRTQSRKRSIQFMIASQMHKR